MYLFVKLDRFICLARDQAATRHVERARVNARLSVERARLRAAGSFDATGAHTRASPIPAQLSRLSESSSPFANPRTSN
jgi:hypothetical protein